jgi:hypothetical protein
MDFVAKEKIALALGSPLRIGIGVASGTIAFSLHWQVLWPNLLAWARTWVASMAVSPHGLPLK